MRLRLSVFTKGGILLGILTLFCILYETNIKCGITAEIHSLLFGRETRQANINKEQNTFEKVKETTNATPEINKQKMTASFASKTQRATESITSNTETSKQHEMIVSLSTISRVTESSKLTVYNQLEKALTIVPTIHGKNIRTKQKLKKKSSISATKLPYPLNIDMLDIIGRIDSNEPVPVKPINSLDFEYIFNPSFRCEIDHGTYPFVVILVKSTCENFKKRKIIRMTWGDVTKFRNTVQVVFLLGYCRKHREQVAGEYNNFTDIVSEDFEDTYKNVTYKTIMGFQWAVKCCPTSKFFLFVDDDYFVNMKNLIKVLSNTRDNNLFTGYVVWNGLPQRSGKWFVSKKEYPGNHYPPYVAGGAYITSYHVARMFSIVFPYIQYLGIEDVYIGIVAYKVNITPTYNPKILKQGDNSCWKKVHDILACHRDALKIPMKKT